MVYLKQSFKGIPVYNQLKTLAFRGGRVVSDAGVFQESMEKLTGNASEFPGVSPVSALQSAFKEAKVEATEQAIPISVLENGRKFEFGKLGASQLNITAELIWVSNNKGEYRLAWQVFLAPVKSSDYWLIRVDAQTGAVINKDNLTVTCKWDQALAVPFEELLASPSPAARHYPKATLPVRERQGALVRSLLPHRVPNMVLERLELSPGARMTGTPHTPGTREYLTCERGALELTASGERYQLAAGDVVVFRDEQKHGYANVGAGVAVGYPVVVLRPVPS